MKHYYTRTAIITTRDGIATHASQVISAEISESLPSIFTTPNREIDHDGTIYKIRYIIYPHASKKDAEEHAKQDNESPRATHDMILISKIF